MKVSFGNSYSIGRTIGAPVSAFGVDDKVATTNHERQAELLHRVIDLAKRNYLPIDKSKVGKTGLYRLSARGTFDAIFIG